MEFRPVVGYEGLYEVSDTGIVRGVKSGKVLKYAYTYNGYPRVSLYRDAKKKTVMVHRLVAIAFLGLPPSEQYQINHKDGDKTNNNVSNLEWCTQSDNIRHSYAIGIREYNKKRLIETNRKAVIQKTLNGVPIKEWYSMSEAARALNLDVSNICNCCKGLIKSTGGFKWEKLVSGC